MCNLVVPPFIKERRNPTIVDVTLVWVNHVILLSFLCFDCLCVLVILLVDCWLDSF